MNDVNYKSTQSSTIELHFRSLHYVNKTVKLLVLHVNYCGQPAGDGDVSIRKGTGR